jgi:hypothetical protein
MRIRLSVVWAGAALILASIVPVYADTISEPFNFAPTVTPFTIDSSPIPEFNRKLGTLESVSITLSGTAIGHVTIGNDSGGAGTYTFSVGTPMLLLDPSLVKLLTLTPTFKGSLVIPGDALGHSALVISPTITDTTTLASGFDLYEGSGTYTLGLLAAGSLGTASGGRDSHLHVCARHHGDRAIRLRPGGPGRARDLLAVAA